MCMFEYFLQYSTIYQYSIDSLILKCKYQWYHINPLLFYSSLLLLPWSCSQFAHNQHSMNTPSCDWEYLEMMISSGIGFRNADKPCAHIPRRGARRMAGGLWKCSSFRRHCWVGDFGWHFSRVCSPFSLSTSNLMVAPTSSHKHLLV
jgi:hypothetical protein